jgi:hypothetical protein
MHRRYKKAAYIFVSCIALVVFFITYRVYISSGSDSSCCQVVDSTAESPGGEWIAQAMEQSWGLSGGQYIVMLENRIHGTETVFDFMPPDSGPFDLHWRDSKTLEIEYPGATEIYKKLHHYKDIVIIYTECPVSKRGIGSKKCIL